MFSELPGVLLSVIGFYVFLIYLYFMRWPCVCVLEGAIYVLPFENRGFV